MKIETIAARRHSLVPLQTHGSGISSKVKIKRRWNISDFRPYRAVSYTHLDVYKRQGERFRVNGFPVQVLAYADEDQPLPALRDAEVLRVEHRGLHAVAAFLAGAQDELEVALGLSLIHI